MTVAARLIVNPVARNGLAGLGDAQDLLRRQGWRVETCYTAAKDDGIRLAMETIEQGFDVAVACGGDGTVNEVANGLAGSKVALGVIPMGTGNAWAREVGLPRKAVEAARVLIDGQIRYVDLGNAGGRCFLLMAGIGLDAEVARHVQREAKRRLGILAYLLAGVWTGLQFTGTPATVTIDGRVLRRRVLMVVVGNTRLYGGLVGVTAQAVADDGLLDACVFTGRGLTRKLTHAANVLVGRHTKTTEVEYYQCRSLNVSARQALPIQVDGDPLYNTLTTISVMPKALRVILPAKVPAHLFTLDPIGRLIAS